MEAIKAIIKTVITGFVLLCSNLTDAQPVNQKVSQILNKVSLDTLVSYVRILSGEDSVRFNSQKNLIVSRKPGTTTHQLAGEFIRQTLVRFGLRLYDQYFTKTVSGHNIYAVQEGVDTTSKYIICAHYDAVTDFCADDNASGVAAVLEAARLLSKVKPDHTIIYALWDQEEKGLIGSSYFAARADSLRMNIQGVLNLDMLGWDSNADGRAEIHTRKFGNSVDMADRINSVNSTYSIGLNPFIINPGTTASDHSSFWNRNYTAVLLIEAYSGGDFNPNYHKVVDRISLFNSYYFYRMSKLAIASLSSMVMDTKTTVDDIQFPDSELSLGQNYPNPLTANTNIRFYLSEPSFTEFKIYNSTGYEVAVLISGDLEKGSHQVTWNSGTLPDGMYFYKLQACGRVLIRKMVVIK